MSGGADSMALLVLAAAAGCRVTAIHVDHGARPAAADDEAAVVAAAAERFGARFDRRALTIDPSPGNLEERWRDARRAALPAGALTGHTADDVAETVLLHAMRGAALDGWAGIRPGPTKPILRLRRMETVGLCRSLGLEPVCDPTNADPAFARNRVRHEVLPLLDDVAKRDVAAALARQASVLGDEADFLESLAAGTRSDRRTGRGRSAAGAGPPGRAAVAPRRAPPS